jgi:hypothetical protein
LDRAIINPWFLGGGFVGALVFTLMAAILHRESKALPWVVTALLLYATAFLVTLVIHLPLNDALKAAGDPDRITDLGAVRRAFNEPRWASWNVVRAATTTLAFCAACLGASCPRQIDLIPCTLGNGYVVCSLEICACRHLPAGNGYHRGGRGFAGEARARVGT